METKVVHIPSITKLLEEIESLKKENERLKEYTRHVGDCRGSLRRHTKKDEVCTCGLDELLKGE